MRDDPLSHILSIVLRERAASPAESLMSVASQMPPPSTTARQSNSGRGANGAPPSKRSKAQAAAAAAAEETASRPEILPPSTSHPSLPLPFSNTARTSSGARNSTNEWPAGQLEGPGMPLAQSFPGTPVQAADPDTESVAAPADGDQEGDDTNSYCLCGRGSFGEMIACDGVGCVVEWVSIRISASSLYADKHSSTIWNV